MAGSNTVTLKFIGDTRDLDKSFRTVETGLDKSQSKFQKWGAALKPIAVTAGAAIAAHFGRASVDAFKDAEQAQNRLQDAFRKFPALADTNISALRKLNEQLAQKTRYDDDATATGQAVLAQFKLTGAQIMQLTPLLQDYAAKTGKDLPTAANDLGKALMGQGRALKAIGIDFTDTGSTAGNFNQLMAGLRAQVGGFAESEGKTAAGQAEILRNKFGELQEKVGAALLPALQQLANALIALIGWFEKLSTPMQATIVGLLGITVLIGPLTGLINSLSTAVRGLGIAFAWLAANPVVLVISAGVALGVVLNRLAEAHFPGVNRALERFGGALYDVSSGAIGAITNAIRTMVSWIDKAIDKFTELVKKVKSVPGGGTIGNIVKGAIPGAGLIPGLASGGIVTKPTLAVIGEAGPEAVLPLGRGGTIPGAGMNVTIVMPPGTDGADVVNAIKQYERRNGTGWRT